MHAGALTCPGHYHATAGKRTREKPAMPESVYRDSKGKWVESPRYRIKSGDMCPGASDFANPFHDLAFREFEVLRAFPAYAASLDRKPARLVDALVVLEQERHTVVNWIDMQEDKKDKRHG